MATKRELLAELNELKALLSTRDAQTSQSANEGESFGGLDFSVNVENTEKYGVDYAFVTFVDASGNPLRQVRGNKRAEEALKALKAIRYGDKGRGKAQWNKKARAWSIQTQHLSPEVVAFRFKK